MDEMEKLIAKWEAYAKGMREGMSKLIHEETIELASHRLEMAERFIADLERMRPKKLGVSGCCMHGCKNSGPHTHDGGGAAASS